PAPPGRPVGGRLPPLRRRRHRAARVHQGPPGRRRLQPGRDRPAPRGRARTRPQPRALPGDGERRGAAGDPRRCHPAHRPPDRQPARQDRPPRGDDRGGRRPSRPPPRPPGRARRRAGRSPRREGRGAVPRPMTITELRRTHRAGETDDSYRWWVLAVTSIGALLASLTSGTLVIALPDILRDLHTDLFALMWIVVGYTLVATVLVLNAGRI